MSSKRNEPYGGKIKNPLAALYGEIGSAGGNTSVSLEQIHLPQSQPRRYFDPQAQQDLVESVRQHGILQPLLVRPLSTGGYELVAGERRYRAAREIGLTEVPIVERELSDTEALQLALIENLQREDLNPVEETEAVLQLLALELNLKLEEVSTLLYRLKHEADRTAKQSGHNVMPKLENGQEQSGHNVMPNTQLESIQTLFARLGSMTWESFVKNRLPLLNLPANIFKAVATGTLQYTKAIALNRIKDEKARSTALEKAIAEDWSLAQIREHIKSLKFQPDQTSLKQQLDEAYQKAKKAKVWEDPARQERLSAILRELEVLLEG
jgi:ParB family transcriptional regulator, chromosome partitioning protein